MATGQPVETLKKSYRDGVSAVAFSCDGRRLAVGSGGAEAIKLWDPETREEVLTLSAEGSQIHGLKFSPDGRYLLGTTSRDNYGMTGYAHLWFAPTLAEIAAEEAAEKTFRAASTPDLDAQPQSSRSLRDRANSFARRGQWKEAAADFSSLIQFDRTDHGLHHALAPLLAQMGDLEGYRRHCAQVLALFGGTDDPVVAERMAKDCLILPTAGIDLDAAARLAGAAVTNGGGHAYSRSFEFAKGLAEYRQGHFAAAVDWTQKALADPGADFFEAQACLVPGDGPISVQASRGRPGRFGQRG